MGMVLRFFLLCIEQSVINGHDMRERKREMGSGEKTDSKRWS